MTLKAPLLAVGVTGLLNGCQNLDSGALMQSGVQAFQAATYAFWKLIASEPAPWRTGCTPKACLFTHIRFKNKTNNGSTLANRVIYRETGSIAIRQFCPPNCEYSYSFL